MTVIGYGVGPIDCEAAFTADFDVDPAIPIADVVTQMDSDRRVMAAREGMIMKYAPLRFDPASGAHQIGGRYLFETRRQMRDYVRFTSDDLEFEPGVKFWERPFFSAIRRQAWDVVGAYAFSPIGTHYATRVERFALTAPMTINGLRAAWSRIREAAADQDLAAVWLLLAEDDRQILLLTATTAGVAATAADQASLTIAALERRPSLSGLLDDHIVHVPIFDRTSVNLAIWLPRSAASGGEACIFPSHPVHPRPGAPIQAGGPEASMTGA